MAWTPIRPSRPKTVITIATSTSSMVPPRAARPDNAAPRAAGRSITAVRWIIVGIRLDARPSAGSDQDAAGGYGMGGLRGGEDNVGDIRRLASVHSESDVGAQRRSKVGFFGRDRYVGRRFARLEHGRADLHRPPVLPAARYRDQVDVRRALDRFAAGEDHAFVEIGSRAPHLGGDHHVAHRRSGETHENPKYQEHEHQLDESESAQAGRPQPAHGDRVYHLLSPAVRYLMPST